MPYGVSVLGRFMRVLFDGLANLFGTFFLDLQVLYFEGKPSLIFGTGRWCRWGWSLFTRLRSDRGI